MKASDVVVQLRKTLPFQTTLFSSSVNVTSLTYLAGIVTAVTSTPHGLSTNNLVVITGALTPNPITSLTRVGDVAYATTDANHDLTEGYPDGDDTTVTIQGASSAAYNGVHKLLSVPNRRNFTYEVLGSPATPDLGPAELLENKAFGYNGAYLITVINSTTFTYTLPYIVGTPAQGTIEAYFHLRVTSAVSVERAVDMYSKFNTNELWAFVVLDDVSISKDRAIESDPPQKINSGIDYRLTEINPFSVYVFAPETYSLSGANARDVMEDVRIYLYKCLLGYKFDTGLNAELLHNALWMVYTTGHSRIDYNGAYYIHQFRFESVSDISYADTIGPDINVAFRDIDLNFIKNEDVAQVIMHTLVDLDDEPLS